MNGDSVSTQHVVFTNTRSWKNYWTTSIRVTLKKGENTVLLGNANGYAPNFDSMAVARTAVQTSPEPLPEPSVDKSAMQTLISKAKGVAEKDCTKESYAVLSAALQSAETVDAKADASQDEVDTAAAALQKALDGLKKAEGGTMVLVTIPSLVQITKAMLVVLITVPTVPVRMPSATPVPRLG